jgi:hypothetical protein
MNIDNIFVFDKDKILVKIKEGELHKYNDNNYGKEYESKFKNANIYICADAQPFHIFFPQKLKDA